VPEWISNLIEQARALPPGRRLALALTGLGSLAFFLWLGYGAAGADYRPLYRGLAEDEAARVVEALSTENIPYRLSSGGTGIDVPAEAVYEARIRLAGRGLPSGGGVGFELFDRPGFGVSDFVHRVNFRRALQGELARSIETLEAVDRARVQIALPESTVFVGRERRQPSASVVLRLRPGAELGESTARGIVHLVASSVEGLTADRVTVVDDLGRLLAPQGEGGAFAVPATELAHQARVEALLARRIEDILEPTVGIGRVVAQVRAELDWTRRESEAERYDPDSQVARSEQISTETTSESGGAPGGVAGLAANTPDLATAPGGGGGSSSSTQSTETINYEISKTVVREVEPLGDVKRLHVAVLVDGKPAEPGADPAAAGFVPWSPEELREFEKLARQAVGFDEDRGDEITLHSAPFRSLALEEEAPPPWADPTLLGLVATALRVLGVALVVVLFARLVVRPLAGALGPGPTDALPAGGMTAAQMEAQLAGGGAAAPTPPAPASLAEQVAQVTQIRSDDSVKAVRKWLREE